MQIKGKHISAVFKHLSQKAKELQELKSKKNTDSIEEIKHFVAHDLKKIQSQQKSLALHISACEVYLIYSLIVFIFLCKPIHFFCCSL